MLSTPARPLAHTPWLDLGPAWFWPHQQHVRALIDELALPVFEQHRDGLARYEAGAGRAPESFDAAGQSDPAYRLLGGMAALTQALHAAAAQSAPTPLTVHLDAAVLALRLQTSGVRIEGTDFGGIARTVIVAVPPRVVARDIVFAPALSSAMQATLADTVTWMGHAMKCVATYDAPFWRTAGQSGYAVSWGGPLQEIHDACTPSHEDAPATHALMGFVAPRTTVAARAFREATTEERRTAVLAQLSRLFGPEALNATDYAEYDWTHDPRSCGALDEMPPSTHPDYGDALFNTETWHGRLIWAGSETSAIGGGYLDGAVASGLRAARAVLSFDES